ncbi:PAS/PAC sensor hybrid histidine kinase [Cnuella takakiae]|uniref:histidine kinase n=1 Tax=Cnuella takakiae TaxID=1302690 RepID=A0A1M5FPX6_9BACT|nr:hybrid sensor histidine kinase/response regulator [Cnuella takakiae]OLY93680.1 hybrid sensor histidine kinase/response regulator [Cnuella takakiae]SHF93474.1 PAS/PAC sensor hybrid histidine kinase [Cnuella takakiae]
MSEQTNKPVRILIIDDDEDDFFITSEYLKQIQEYALKVDWSYRFSDAIQLVQNRAYDMYFVDYRLGAKTGIDFLKEAVAVGCEEPIVLLTGKGNKSIDIQAMQMGATDYLVKTELNVDKLERCIRYALERTAYVKALRANERKYRSIFELSKDAVFIASKDLRFRDMNQATSDLLGYSREDLSGMSVFDLVEDDAERRTLQRILQREGEINDIELELLTNGGEKKSCIFSAMLTTEGTVDMQYQGLIHDITNMKKAERANLLVEKLAATGRLVRTLAHEVRNPLNNINMSVEQLGHGLEVEEAPLYLDIIQRNSKRIGDLITELLDSSRPSELSFERCVLQTVMDDSIAEAMDRITLQRTNMQISYCDEPCWIMGNPEKLKIAFLNIIINAVEAMAVNEGELEIEMETNGLLHKVSIRDNGSGIPEENLSRLFEPYFTSKRNGMGLGLAATLNILQAHKAHIDVSSIVGEGTTFVITFPSA